MWFPVFNVYFQMQYAIYFVFCLIVVQIQYHNPFTIRMHLGDDFKGGLKQFYIRGSVTCFDFRWRE